jgi:hypothetical protein
VPRLSLESEADHCAGLLLQAEREVQKKQKEAAKKEKAQRMSSGQSKTKKNAKRWN